MSVDCNRCNPISRRWSKRFRATVVFLLFNFATLWAAMYDGLDVLKVAKALVITNGPLFGYLWAESIKPSKET